MSRARVKLGGALGTLAAVLVAVACTPAAAITDEEIVEGDAEVMTVTSPRLVNLNLVEADGVWHPENRFDLRWSFDLPPHTSKLAVHSVRYQVLDASQRLILDSTELPGPREGADAVRLPDGGAVPGQYSVRAWATGVNPGPVATATLRFDDRRPAPALPKLPSGWVRGDVEPTLEITPPPGPQPVSGIRGYAISVRAGDPAPPCAGPDRCSVEETDLRGGLGANRLPLGGLAEGVHAVSVVAVSNSGMRSTQANSAEIRVDASRPEIVVQGIGAGWSREPVRVVAQATDPLSGMSAAGPAGPTTSIAVDDGPPTVARGDEVAAIVAGSGVHTVSAGARDAAGNVRGDSEFSPPLTKLVRIDETAPAVSFSAGEDPAEPELLEATVQDGLSGPDLSRGSIAVRPLGSGRSFEPLATSASQGRLRARWDSDSYPRGNFEFRVSGFDLAGNVASSTLRGNGATMVLANPVKVPSALRFGFGGRKLIWQRCQRAGEGRRCHREVIGPFAKRPTARVVPSGQGVQVGGRLVSAAGAPLADRAVDLIETFASGASAGPRATSVRTDAKGFFVARLGPGPSRRVEARFAGTRVLTRGASRELRLGVRTSVRLRASSARAAIGGAPVVFSGRVAHQLAAIPSYGRPIQFQFRLPGRPWTEFRTVQTDAKGRFHFPYAFSDDDSRGIRFLFRAYAPRQPGWPYEPGVSRPVAVTGQ